MPEAVEVLITHKPRNPAHDATNPLPFQRFNRRAVGCNRNLAPSLLAHEAAEETTDQKKTVPENSIESTRSVVIAISPW